MMVEAKGCCFFFLPPLPLSLKALFGEGEEKKRSIKTAAELENTEE